MKEKNNKGDITPPSEIIEESASEKIKRVDVTDAFYPKRIEQKDRPAFIHLGNGQYLDPLSKAVFDFTSLRPIE